jgi:WD40 repeat protein
MFNNGNLTGLILSHFNLYEISRIYKCIKNSFLFELSTIKQTESTSNPNRLILNKAISLPEFKRYYTENSIFIIFTSRESEPYISWGTKDFGVKLHNLVKESTDILIGHSARITYLGHHDRAADFLISVSDDKACKVWNITNKTCVIALSQCHSDILSSALIVNTVDGLYPVTVAHNEPTKIWNSMGKNIRNIDDTASHKSVFMNIWYDSTDIYIINGNDKGVMLYDFYTYKTKCFVVNQNDLTHVSAFVKRLKGVAYLFECDEGGRLRQWGINKQTVYMEIIVRGFKCRDMCLWNNGYVIASWDNSFNIFDIKDGVLSSSVHGHIGVICSLWKVLLPGLGECLLTICPGDSIKLWSFSNLK